jgi:hypothetical protein
VSTPTLLVHKPNITVCNSFCHETWEACVGPPRAEPSPAAAAAFDDEAPHVHFCTQHLGVHVAAPQPALLPLSGGGGAACFSTGHRTALPSCWLTLGAPALAVALMACAIR